MNAQSQPLASAPMSCLPIEAEITSAISLMQSHLSIAEDTLRALVPSAQMRQDCDAEKTAHFFAALAKADRRKIARTQNAVQDITTVLSTGIASLISARRNGADTRAAEAALLAEIAAAKKALLQH